MWSWSKAAGLLSRCRYGGATARPLQIVFTYLRVVHVPYLGVNFEEGRCDGLNFSSALLIIVLEQYFAPLTPERLGFVVAVTHPNKPYFDSDGHAFPRVLHSCVSQHKNLLDSLHERIRPGCSTERKPCPVGGGLCEYKGLWLREHQNRH